MVRTGSVYRHWESATQLKWDLRVDVAATVQRRTSLLLAGPCGAGGVRSGSEGGSQSSPPPPPTYWQHFPPLKQLGVVGSESDPVCGGHQARPKEKQEVTLNFPLSSSGLQSSSRVRRGLCSVLPQHEAAHSRWGL